MANSATHRISKEITNIQRNTDLSLAVACRDHDVRSVRALIIGPPETPYEFGFFEFDVRFPKDYPLKAPHVRCITTNAGRTRFNPNIYAEGKVCLSILGTWRGERGEEWSSAQGLESVLLSIQSLMSVNPYENEPAYENSKVDQPKPKAYVAKIRHETLRVSVIQRLEDQLNINSSSSRSHSPDSEKENSPDVWKGYGGGNGKIQTGDPDTPQSDASSSHSAHEYDAEATYAASETSWDPFADLMKRRFLWYYSSYLKTIERCKAEQKDGQRFERTEFEYPPNSMEGTFAYRRMKPRLVAVRKALDAETDRWANDGLREVDADSSLAVQLRFQSEQLNAQRSSSSSLGSKLEIALEDQNPFVWSLTLFGGSNTNLDGGVFNMTLHFSPRFPDEQPRVRVLTPIFHHRVSPDGVLCYFPQKPDEVPSHVEAICAAIEDESPRYDPRAMVHPEASELCWGGEDRAKIYRRKLRRSAQESSCGSANFDMRDFRIKQPFDEVTFLLGAHHTPVALTGGNARGYAVDLLYAVLLDEDERQERTGIASPVWES